MKHVIGIDIGGTKITGVVWDGKKVVGELTIVTPGSAVSFERNLLKLVDFLSAKHEIVSVGVGMAGAIDVKAGIAVSSPNIPYIKKFLVLETLRKHGYKNLGLDNDANCFLRAEVEIGAARRYRNAFGLVVGTGVGGAMFLDGQYYRGSDNRGGEIGRWLVEGKPLEKLYQHYKKSNDYKNLTRVFTVAFANLINLLTPECVVVGGTYGQLYADKFLVPALSKANEYVMSDVKPKLIVSKLKSSGAIGAALLVS